MPNEPATKYNNYGQAGAFGDGAQSNNNTFLQPGSVQPLDPTQLIRQLGQIRAEMKRTAKGDDSEQDAEIGMVAQAERAAQSGDSSGAIGFLKSAGKWTLEIAKSVAAGVVEDAIEGKFG